ncbi:DUF58 domain-containing protein [Granulosicoccus antarcticus]|uniref:DUF58 domain-containing protein n=1 Tax=Granulosicoccus antarcticus IMCC3135 TaxID=1192854 RepID=A0A2Z2NSI1_9GAMM|nr:DUF58 domain-containing protein [Granulosicoccus antarcticus]ASJ74249.1 hypothetical protein IMCC3135_20860 [Granulosicoccus antarcticus IMCC3135]
MNVPETDNLDDPSVSISVQSLLDERHSTHTSTLHQPAGTGQWTGNFRGSRRGHGTDFDDLRHYSPGDEIRHIDWKASARTNTLHTRLYREEREHRVTLITDLRSSMFTGTHELRSVKACRVAARLLWQAVEGGSRTSVVGVCDTGLFASEYGNGHRAAIDACGLLSRRFEDARQQATSSLQRSSLNSDKHESTDVLITLPGAYTEHGEPPVTFEQVAHWLITQRRLHGTIIWISAFDQLGDKFNEAMQILSQATRQAAVHINDVMLEQALPTGRYGYRSGDPSNWTQNRAPHAITINRQQRQRLQQQLSEQKQQRIARFSDLLIPLLDTDAGNTQIVTVLRQHGYLP